MSAKKCYRCRRLKPISEFNKNSARPDGLQSKCRDCQRVGYRDYYTQDDGRERDRLRGSNRRARDEKTAYLRDLKERAACADCKINYPFYVMDFDHREGEQKTGEISDWWYRWGWARLQAEIAKCDIVCSNCHRARTWNRAQRHSPVV